MRFSVQQILNFKGTNYGIIDKELRLKLAWDLKYNKELCEMYELVTKLVINCIDRNIPLIIENPYAQQHYLVRYWALDAAIIDKDRTLNGDYYNKPTQYFFVNCEPLNNLIFEPLEEVEYKVITETYDKTERSEIHPQYADRFIRQYILDKEVWKGAK